MIFHLRTIEVVMHYYTPRFMSTPIAEPKTVKHSYSQCGEDLIVDHILKLIGVAMPTYVDVGAHDPYEMNNTYLFYRRGCSGILVEPNPELLLNLTTSRPRDYFAGCAVGASSGTATYHVMTKSTLNTTTGAQLDLIANSNHKRSSPVLAVAVENVPLRTLPDVWRTYYPPESVPDFVSIDVEGAEPAVLYGIDFTTFRPKVFCIETLKTGTSKVNRLPVEILQRNGYEVRGSTYVNTVLVDADLIPN
jgi:FkbM family methyltransferase